jgi:hypothetical protein
MDWTSYSLLLLQFIIQETYSQEMAQDRSKFDPDVLMNISNRLVSAAYELNQSYENYKSVRPSLS